jgi:hypothetical protein
MSTPISMKNLVIFLFLLALIFSCKKDQNHIGTDNSTVFLSDDEFAVPIVMITTTDNCLALVWYDGTGLRFSKLDQQLNVKWTFKADHNLYSLRVCHTSDGGFCVAGAKMIKDVGVPVKQWRYEFYRFDGIGTLLWNKEYVPTISNNQSYINIAQANDEGFVCVAPNNTSVIPMQDTTAMLRLSASGDSLWFRKLNYHVGAGATKIISMPDSTFSVCYPYSIYKLDPNGNVINASKYGLHISEWTSDATGSLILSGFTQEIPAVAKVGLLGNILWEKQYPELFPVADILDGHDICVNSDGGTVFIIDNGRPILVKTDNSGFILSETELGYKEIDDIEYLNGKYFITGLKKNSSDKIRIFVEKIGL